MNATSFVIPAPAQASIPVAGEAKSFPVRRIWCVGRNYLEHIREMGNDERAPPFFFAKHADMLEADGATIPYPPLTKDLHHEVELIVAMKSGGLNIPADKALGHIYGYAVGIDLTRRDLQQAARKKERPWEIGKSFDHSAPCSALHFVRLASGCAASTDLWWQESSLAAVAAVPGRIAGIPSDPISAHGCRALPAFDAQG